MCRACAVFCAAKLILIFLENNALIDLKEQERYSKTTDNMLLLYVFFVVYGILSLP
jgi:hypothetical protein